VIVVVLLLVIAAVLVPAFSGVSRASPRTLLRSRLIRAGLILEKFHDTEKRWPETYRSLVDFAANQGNPLECFLNPVDKTEHDWLLLTPTETASTMDGEPRILLAAPLPGGFLPQDSNKRLVLFENGKTDWIPESDFERLANDKPPAR
jgi:hypothetical protein